MNTILALAAIYMIVMALILNTRSVLYAVIFKVIPFFLGLGVTFVALKNFGLI